MSGVSTTSIVSFARAPHDGGLDARQRTAHRSRPDVHRREVRDHDAAGFRLPPVVVERPAERLDAPHDRFGIERLADAGEEAQRRASACCLAASTPAFIIMRIAVGAVYQTRHLLASQDRVPALGVEVRFVDDARQAVRERRDDAVRRAGDPAGIGRAPEDVVRMEVEREARRRVMRDDGLVHVDRALGLAGRAAGEVQQRRVFRDRSAGS